MSEKGICRVCGCKYNKELDNFMASGTICFNCYRKRERERETTRLGIEKMILLEKTAREEAFRNFLHEIQKSMLIWEIDENIQNNLESVSDYFSNCANTIVKILNKD